MVAEGDCSLMDPEVFGVLQVGKMVLYGLDVNMVHLAGLLWQAWERRSGNTGDKGNNEGAVSFLEGWDSVYYTVPWNTLFEVTNKNGKNQDIFKKFNLTRNCC